MRKQHNNKQHNNNHKKLWCCLQVIYAENTDKPLVNYHKHVKILGQETGVDGRWVGAAGGAARG